MAEDDRKTGRSRRRPSVRSHANHRCRSGAVERTRYVATRIPPLMRRDQGMIDVLTEHNAHRVDVAYAEFAKPVRLIRGLGFDAGASIDQLLEVRIDILHPLEQMNALRARIALDEVHRGVVAPDDGVGLLAVVTGKTQGAILPSPCGPALLLRDENEPFTRGRVRRPVSLDLGERHLADLHPKRPVCKRGDNIGCGREHVGCARGALTAAQQAQVTLPQQDRREGYLVAAAASTSTTTPSPCSGSVKLIPYVFKTWAGTVLASRLNDQDRAMSNTMSACWVAFATRGTPSCSGALSWPAYTPARDEQMEFGEVVTVRQPQRRAAFDLLVTQFMATAGSGRD